MKKTVLVNGGSRGIGRAVVEAFAHRGYRVAFTYKNSEEAARCLALSVGALAIRADTACEEEVVAAVARAEEELSGIGCLVNNAAVAGFSLFTDITLSEWNRFLSVNLTGAFLYSREVLKYMLPRHEGKIVNMASMWGVTGASCEVHYSAAKAGLIGMTRALAKEVGPSGITVNAVAPGVIMTDMNRALSEDDLAALREETPLMKLGTAEDVARAVLFLAGEGGDFITGEVLNVNGGFVI